MRLGMIFLRSLEAFGDLPRLFWVVLSESGKGLGRHGQALEPLNCVLDASWERLRGFRRRLEANLRCLGQALEPLSCVLHASWEHLERFGRRLEAHLGCLWGFESHWRVPKAGPGLVLRASRGGFGRFFAVFSGSQAKIEN